MTASINMASTFAVPGLGTSRTYTPRNIWWGDAGTTVYAPGGRVIASADARDPLNTANVSVLRPGLLLGKVSASGNFGQSVIGIGTEALDGGETAFTLSAATAVELVRRQGATGTFKITGPPVAGGTVRTMTATYSAVDTTTGVVTMTALGVADVQTIAFAAGTDAGTFKLTYKGLVTDSLAYNVSAADMQIALRALHGDLVAVTVASSVPGVDYVITNPQVGGLYTLEDIGLISEGLQDTPVVETYTITHTTQGVGGDFVTGSWIQPTDGSETILTILDEHTVVLDPDGVAQDVGFRVPIRGNIDVSYITNYPADAALKAYCKAALNAVGSFVFSDAL